MARYKTQEEYIAAIDAKFNRQRSFDNYQDKFVFDIDRVIAEGNVSSKRADGSLFINFEHAKANAFSAYVNHYDEARARREYIASILRDSPFKEGYTDIEIVRG